ncbi:MAG: DUF3052 family protein [Ancrocorticia sp.]|uniref:DUF3052 family protein n=1 Tax=Ancrocorticia sp. TaxID=2593684 RepID=UPI003F903DCA
MGSFGFTKGSIVQEFGYDEDVDFDVRSAIEGDVGRELVDEEYPDIADAALGWWREEDGDADDLADLLLDMKANMDSEDAVLWLLVPGPRETGYVETSLIEEAAETAGLLATTSAAVSTTWTGVRLSHQGQRR